MYKLKGKSFLVEISFAAVPGQTDLQVHASFGLAFKVSFGHPLAWTCIDFGQAQIWMQVDTRFYHLATQRKSAQVDRKY